MTLNMLIETREGFDYTGADCRGWMADVGFHESYVEPLVGPDSMVVAIKWSAARETGRWRSSSLACASGSAHLCPASESQSGS